ncbi:MAG: hypothetical protein WD883_00525 [Candidatus Colwellbacteria bacterium]
MSIKDLATGTVITLLIGGTAYTVSQTDVIRNFADDTGLTQEQAEQYVNKISEEELVGFDEAGLEFTNSGQGGLSAASEIDCVNYEYEWESVALSCYQGKTQLEKIGRDEIALGQAYKNLSLDSASVDDISKTISLIDQVNSNYELQIVRLFLDGSTIDEMKKANSYNKAVLQAALDGS